MQVVFLLLLALFVGGQEEDFVLLSALVGVDVAQIWVCCHAPADEKMPTDNMTHMTNC